MKLRPFIHFYIWQYVAIGSFSPFISLYLAQIGFDGMQMGLLFGLTPIVSLLIQPIWGVVADVLSMRRRIVTAACVLTALVALTLPAVSGFAWVMLVLLILTMVRSPIVPIAAAITLEALGPRRDMFPQIRLWGSLSFGLASLAVGTWVVDRNVAWIVYVFAAAMLIAGLASRRLPSSRAQFGARWWEAWDVVRGNTPYLMFLLALVLLQFTHPLATAYLPLYFKELGAPGWAIGALWGIASTLEVPLMALTPHLMRRFGGKRVLLFLTAAVPIRWLLLHAIANPFLILPFQFLHSMAAAAYYAAAITYVDGMVPSRWRATGQAFYGAVSEGLAIGGGVAAVWLAVSAAGDWAVVSGGRGGGVGGVVGAVARRKA